MSITELLPDRFGHALFAVWIVLFAIDVFLPRTRRSVVSLYDAGMFAIIVVLLAWGVLRVAVRNETEGWSMIILAAGLFGWKIFYRLMLRVFLQHPKQKRATGRW
jgi:hypothetical protein